MASQAQNLGENPQHVLWNNNNTELEEGRQIMMGFSCIKAVYNTLLTSITEKKYWYYCCP